MNGGGVHVPFNIWTVITGLDNLPSKWFDKSNNRVVAVGFYVLWGDGEE